MVSTASPYKFPKVVLEGLENDKTELSVNRDDFAAVKSLEKLSGIPLPKAVIGLEEAEVLHHTVIPAAEMQKRSRKISWLKMKTNREILKFAFPAIIENFLQMLVGVSDTMIVAHLSLSAVAAVSLANNLITVYQAIFIALGTIVSSLFAKVLIAKR